MSRHPHRRPGYRRWYSTLERERFGLTWELDPPPPPSDLSVPGLVNKALQGFGLDQDLWHRQILEAWPEMVGPDITRRARPGRIENRVLTVYVTSSAWLSELSRFGQRQILAKLQARFGPDRIRSVRLALDPDLNA